MYCEECRICKNNNLEDVIFLGDQAITSRFPIYNDFSTPKTDITLCLCPECGLLQLRTTTNSSELYEHEYGYNSGISNTMRQHLKDYQEQVLSKVELKNNDIIIDIGSNDATTLKYYSSNLRRIGVDPTGNQFKDKYTDTNIELIPTYFTYKNVVDKCGDIKCKVISSISMFYDLPDPVEFAKDIHKLLDKNGLWTCEQSYLLSMLKTNSIDTICHEHLEYYALHQIKEIADRAGFNIIDVSFNDCNGGSFRIYLAKKESDIYNENTELITSILNEEKNYGITNKTTFTTFIHNCDKEVKKLKEFIQIVNNDNKSVYIYGASTKGNCLLQYGDITQNDIKYAVERNLNKVGKMTSTGIEIISEETMRKNPPDFLLVLPWHFRKEIIARESEFLNNGGQFIFPFPHFEIIGSKPKLLITGCDGMIAKYIKESYDEYNLYGITKSKNNIEKCIVKNNFDMKDNLLEQYILLIQPDIIIHLAGISTSNLLDINVIDMLQTNGLLCAKICDIIYKHKLTTKLFNASSSDIYKGHSNYNVIEDDTHRLHLHPYSIAKIMSSSIIEFYRTEYNLPFSNGIIFTTESEHKSEKFLLKKLSTHITNWKLHQTPIQIGNLQSYRNILYASDVVDAIKLIISQDIGDTYLICNNISYYIEDLVVKLYKKAGIILYKHDTGFRELITDKQVLIINSCDGNDKNITNISGTCSKLHRLGWQPKISIDEILNKYLD